MAPEWRRPEELTRLVEALRATEPRPKHRWSVLVAAARLRRAEVRASAGVLR